MRRLPLLAAVAVVLHAASLSAQQTSRWGDELPPAPPPPDSLFAIPKVELPVLWPAPPLTRPPSPVRAIYVNAWAFGGRRFFDLVKLADRTEINAFVIDVKDDTGYLTYRSEVPTAVAIGANSQQRARDVRERLRVLREHGIHPIARIVELVRAPFGEQFLTHLGASSRRRLHLDVRKLLLKFGKNLFITADVNCDLALFLSRR